MKNVTNSNTYSQLFVLNQKQSAAIELLMSGLTDAEVGAQIGVARETVCRWRLHHPEFIAELNRRRTALLESYEQSARNLVGKAIRAAEEALDSDDQELKVKTACTILKMFNISPSNVFRRSPGDAIEIVREIAQEESMEKLVGGMGLTQSDIDATLKALVRKLEGMDG